MSLAFGYLADHPELAPLLASWFYEEWGRRDPANSVERVEQRLRERMNRDQLPLALVGFLSGQPVASASIIVREMDTHPQYVHWLASVYVQQECRGQGIGSRLIEHAAAEAERLGIRDLYLYTHSHESSYRRLGWRPVERPQSHGREVVIMKRVLGRQLPQGAD